MQLQAAQTLGIFTAHMALDRTLTSTAHTACCVEITYLLLCFSPKDCEFPKDISLVLFLSTS